MPVKKIYFRQINGLPDIYQQLNQQVALPPHFGNNLDALYDFLSSSLTGPIQIIWLDHIQSAELLGKKDYTALMNLFEDLENERDDCEVVLDGYIGKAK